LKTSSIIIGIAIAGIGGYLAYRYFTKKTVKAQTTYAPTYAYGISGIAELESVYGLNTPIYYNPTTKIAQINPPARSYIGGKGALYVT